MKANIQLGIIFFTIVSSMAILFPPIRWAPSGNHVIDSGFSFLFSAKSQNGEIYTTQLILEILLVGIAAVLLQLYFGKSLAFLCKLFQLVRIALSDQIVRRHLGLMKWRGGVALCSVAVMFILLLSVEVFQSWPNAVSFLWMFIVGWFFFVIGATAYFSSTLFRLFMYILKSKKYTTKFL